MTDQLKVQVSAFLDNELLDEECDLFVRRLCSDEDLRDAAGRYAMIGDIVRGESFLGLQDLSKRIHTALDDSPDVVEQKAPISGIPVTATTAVDSRRRFLKPISGLAVAATVAMAAIFLIQSPTELNESDLPSTTVAFVDVGNGATPALTPIGLPGVRPVSVAVQTRMDQYLLHHRNYATQFGNRSILGLRDVGKQYPASNTKNTANDQDNTKKPQTVEPQQ